VAWLTHGPGGGGVLPGQTPALTFD
jgi:hypothetical protein